MNPISPRISVVMPTYNAGEFIERAIKSVLGQSMTDFEFIILNDASKDHTNEIVAKYLDDARIIYIDHSSPQGQCALINEGIEKSSAEFVAIMHSDDIAAPERLERQLEHFKIHPEVDILGTAAFLINEKDDVFNVVVKPLTHEDIRKNIFKYVPLVHPAVMFKKSIFLKVGMYNEALRRAPDYELWLRAIFNGAIINNLVEPLLYYRVHPSQLSSNQPDGARAAYRFSMDAVKRYQVKLSLEERVFIYGKYIVGVYLPKGVTTFLEKNYKKYFTKRYAS